MAHRYLIGAALSGEKCTLTGVEMSEDVLASIDCLKALGADISVNNGTVNICPDGFMMAEKPVLDCRESGSTLRFFIPLALCLGREAVFTGSERLMLRPLDVFEELCRDNGFVFDKHGRTLRVCGSLDGGSYRVRGDISSQFITGLILALVYIGKESQINIIPPLESRPYVEMTVSALRAFGADVTYDGAYTVNVKPAKMHAYCGKIEGDF
jgi:3-phosphoshikimate 1-carboxyvinyltransferase